MKNVAILIFTLFFGLGASAQTSKKASSEKTAVVKTTQKGKTEKIKKKEKKVINIKDENITTLSDEKSYKAKSRFELMLLKRLEVDAAAAEINEKDK